MIRRIRLAHHNLTVVKAEDGEVIVDVEITGAYPMSPWVAIAKVDSAKGEEKWLDGKYLHINRAVRTGRSYR